MLYSSCKNCPLRPALCHGVEDGLGIDSCMSFGRKQCEEFGWTSLYDPKLFAERFHEVGDFGCELRRNLLPVGFKLPPYIPALYHGFDFARPLDIDFAAVPLHVLFRSRADGSMVPIAKTARRLRELLGVKLNAKILVTGSGPDQGIENFWGVHRSDNLLSLLHKLDVCLFTTPNYSFFTNAPPPHNRYNRSRTLRLAERATDAGVVTALHLNAIFELEWKDWEALLQSHPEISTVCMEFQTGYACRTVGDRAFGRLVRLQEAINRPIHPILIGGARYAAKLGQNFSSSTVVDSEPFFKTFHRRNCVIKHDGNIEWKFKRSKAGECLAARFAGNLSEYSRRINDRINGIPAFRQMDLFRNPDEFRVRGRRKQGALKTLPLFSLQTLQQRTPDPGPQSRLGRPNGKWDETRIATPAGRDLPRIESATNRPNLRRKNNFRRQQPNGFVQANTTDGAGGH